MARSGRRPGGTSTRERIGQAARESFGELGYEAATMRGIARRAGVDPALVHHYFGTKQRLFLSVMNLPFDPAEAFAALAGPGRDGFGARLIAFFVGAWDEQPGARDLVTGMVRSAATDQRAAGLLREFLGRQGLFELVGGLAVDQPELRTVLVGSQIVGLAMARYIVGIEPMASAEPARLAAAIGPTIDRYLFGPIG